MRRATHFAVLGRHETKPGWFDAVDVLVRVAGEREVVLGLRTASYLAAAGSTPGEPELWGSYDPIHATLDLTTVKHWNFDRVLWLGPDAWPCLVWSNAEQFSDLALHTIVAADRLIAGPDDKGLPSLDDLGRETPTWLRWQQLRDVGSPA